MHICATNICVWIRTLVLESLKEITLYHRGRVANPNDGPILESIRTHSLRHAATVMGTDLRPETDWEPINLNIRDSLNDHSQESDSILSRMVHTTARAATTAYATLVDTTSTSTTTPSATTTTTRTTTTTPTPTTSTSTTTPWPEQAPTTVQDYFRNLRDFVTSTTTSKPIDDDDWNDAITPSSSPNTFVDFVSTPSTTTTTAATTTTITETLYNMFGMDNALQYSGLSLNETDSGEHRTFESLDALFPDALIGHPTGLPSNTSCGRVNIMGTIVQDSAPYLYPFVVEYSLIGAVVIYVMWKHIGRYPK